MNGRNVKDSYDKFCQVFDQPGYNADKQSFNRKVKALQITFRKWRSKDRDIFLEKFSPGNWKKKTAGQKAKHTLRNCIVCESDPTNHLFPMKSLRSKSSITPAALKANVGNVYFKSPPRSYKATKAELIDSARIIYKSINEVFVNLFDNQFIDILVKVPELGITKKL